MDKQLQEIRKERGRHYQNQCSAENSEMVREISSVTEPPYPLKRSSSIDDGGTQKAKRTRVTTEENTIIDLTEDSPAKAAPSGLLVEVILDLLPHISHSQAKKALAAAGGDPDVAVQLLLGGSPQKERPPPKRDDSSAPTGPGPLLRSTSRPGRTDISREALGAAPPCDAIFRLNALPYCPPEANVGAVSLYQLIEGEGLESAVITTYMVEPVWLFDSFPVLQTVPLTLVHGEHDEEALKEQPRPSSCVLYKPPFPRGMPYSGCIHGKTFMLFYKDRVRVVISTANLLPEDYLRKTQALWYQDFPLRRPPALGQRPAAASDFELTLCDYYTSMQMAQVAAKLRAYDFSGAKVVLVTSVPGYHRGPARDRYGHMKVRAWLQKEKIGEQFVKAPLVCQSSSMGNTTDKWLEEFAASFAPGAASTNVQLVWPTEEFVRGCIDGYNAGGSLCLRQKDAQQPTLVSRMHLYQPAQPGRGHIPPHIKTYARPATDGTLPWALMSSANMSKAAWGQLQKNDTQLFITNYEIGVLFLPSLAGGATMRYGADASMADPKKLTFPYPSRLPPSPYAKSDKVWAADAPHPMPDAFGNVANCS